MKSLSKLVPGQFDNATRFGEPDQPQTYLADMGGAFPEIVTRKEPPPKFKNGRRVDAKLFAKRTMDAQKMQDWCNSVDAIFLNSPFIESAIEEILTLVQTRDGREFNESWKQWPPSKRLLRSSLTDAEIAAVIEKISDPMLFLPADLYFELREAGKIRSE
jgi:hypothetical protein